MSKSTGEVQEQVQDITFAVNSSRTNLTINDNYIRPYTTNRVYYLQLDY